MPASKIVLAVGLLLAVAFTPAIAQTSSTGPTPPGRGQQPELSVAQFACPRGTQVLLLIEQGNVPAYLVVDELPAPGQGTGRRLDARTVSPNEMPVTLDLTSLVGDLDVRVLVRDRTADQSNRKDIQANLAGYIGCGQWQARIAGGQPAAFLLKRAQQSQSSTPAPAAPTPTAPTPVAPAPVTSAPVAPAPVSRAENIANGKLTYRGFTVDVAAIRSSQERDAIIASLQHQIDIAADCGAKQDVLHFFQSQEIVVRSDLRDPYGHFDKRGVSIKAAVAAPQKPIVLHELLHAFHFKVMSGRFRNAEILKFYNRAKYNRFYPEDAYVLKNVLEFFAVTASLYLWGHVDREPYTREKLKATQPIYYAWLGELFGVRK
jgi:hypothetical protein